MPFTLFNNEYRCHTPALLRPMLGKEKKDQATPDTAEVSDQTTPATRNNDSSRRFLFFGLMSVTPKATSSAAQSSGTITDLSWDEAKAELTRFRKNLSDLGPDFDPLTVINNGTLDKPATGLTDAEKWDVRMCRTHVQSGHMNDYLGDNEPGVHLPSTYRVGDKPYGLMLLSNLFPPYIDHIVTLPGTQGVGGALVEHAVNASEGWNKKGVVETLPVNPEARAAFKAIGFTEQEGVDGLRLDPSSKEARDKWRKKGGQWHYLNKKAFAESGPPKSIETH